MAKLMYLATPAEGVVARADMTELEHLVLQTPGWITYKPTAAFGVGEDSGSPDNKIAHLNMVALNKASGLIVYMPEYVPTAGVFMEIELAIEHGIPVAWVGGDKWAAHWSLGLSYIHRADTFEEAIAFVMGAVAANDDIGGRQTQINVKLLHKDAKLPNREYIDDAGFDLYCSEAARIEPNEFVDISCGIAIQPPTGMWFRIIGRSSTFRKRRLLVLEGVIDHGYRGEIFVGVTNMTDKPVTVEVGERLAQMLPQSNWSYLEARLVAKLAPSQRGDNGFGSSGT